MALWWISFVRPLPVVATSSVEFIIQISDDLRTKLYPDAVDIYYIWSSREQSTNPVKLTTWRPEYAHKLLRVNSPPAAGQAITWKLGLTTVSPGTSPSRDMMNISLIQRSVNNDILPVYSAPVSISPSLAPAQNSKRGKTQSVKIQKQDEIQRVYVPPALARPSDESSVEEPSSPLNLITIVEKTSFDLDKRAWDSGVVLASAFARWISNHSLQARSEANGHLLAHSTIQISELQSTLDIIVKPGSRILELGAGCGIVSIILATVLESLFVVDSFSLPKPTQIHITDLPSAIPLITRNIDSNRHPRSQNSETSEEIHVSSVETTAYALDWEDEELPLIVTSNPPDIIMMSDVTYNTASFPALIKTLKNLLRISPAARVIIAYKERHPDERAAWRMFDHDARLSLCKVEEIPGAAGAPVEIWLGSQRACGS